METPAAGPSFHPPKQDRSRRTMDRIADAALAIMEEDGVEAATVAAIVERADASTGSFYARFPGKEDLIHYLEDRVWTEARERWDHALAQASWEGLGVDQVVESVVGLLLRSFRADYHTRKVLGSRVSASAEADRRRRAFHQHLLDAVTRLLMAREDEIQHPDPPRAIRFGYFMVVGGIREILDQHRDLDQSDPGPELARAWLAYLRPGTDGDETGSGDVVDFFDPWG